MNSRVITAIAFKLFAIWLIVQTILQIPFTWQMYFLIKSHRALENVEKPFPYLLFIALIVCGFIAAKVIFSLGDKVIAELPQGEKFMHPHDFEIILFQLLGVYFLVTGLSSFPSSVIAATSVTGESPLREWLWVCSLSFKIAIGIFLIARTNYFCNLMKKFR